MNLIQELRQRRVFQITTAYVVGGWGALQFLAFLENRMAISPHLVNLIGLALILLLPSVVTMAWVHGRPGKDTWDRTAKIVLPANLLAAVLLLVILFSGRDLGAVTQTIAVEDENGAVIERVVPKNEYRRRVLVFYPEISGDQEDAWASETSAYLLSMDMSQDVFLDNLLPLSMSDNVKDAGSVDGHGLPRPQQRKLARDAHVGHFLTGAIGRHDGQWRLSTELHESESGKIVAQRTNEAADLFSLVDQVSRQLREDLDIPSAHLDENPDLPIAELTSSDVQAVASHVQALTGAIHLNDWEGAEPLLEDAVERDPHFALAQFLLFAVRQTLGDTAGALTAITAAMDDLYRVPERLAFMIKAQYYYDVKQDADKALAVIRMWTQIYPDDVTAYEQQALFYFIRQDLPAAIASYEKILSIDPSRVKHFENLADLHTQLGNFAEAESYLKRYIEIFPTRSDGYEDLSDFYSATGRLDEARDTLAQAQLFDPENLALTLSLIDLDIKAGKYGECDRALVGLLTEAKTSRDRMQIIARQINSASLQGRVDELIDRTEAFDTAVHEIKNPLQADIVYALMLPAISEAGRPEEALTRMAEVQSRILAPFNDLVEVAKAWAYADLGRVPEATASLAAGAAVVETFKFETMRAILALVGGLIAEAAGDLDSAIAQYRDASEKAIRTEPIYGVRLARALRLAGREDEAMVVIEAGLKTEPSHPAFQLELAHLAYGQDDLAQARKHLNVVLTTWSEASPEFPPAREAQQLADLLDAL